jgi:hypothetical protein
MKKKTIHQTGILIQGIALLNLWGGEKGEIIMTEKFLANEDISKDNILRCINDAQFGCESIESAWIDIYIDYEYGFGREYDRTIVANLPRYRELYNTEIKHKQSKT